MTTLLPTPEKHTPLMEQYFTIKEQYPDALLLFQVGDFYELFFEDAKKAAAFLAIALTKRGKSKGEDIPLCGIPVHALAHYLTKLVKGGFRVAVCDQLAPPKPGTVVERGVRQVFTPGTLTDSGMLDEKSASYLLSCFQVDGVYGLLFAELLTAQLFATTIPHTSTLLLEAELARFAPDEIIMPTQASTQDLGGSLKKMGHMPLPCSVNPVSSEQALWQEHQLPTVVQEKLAKQPALLESLTLLYQYLRRNNAKALEQITTIHFYQPEDYLILDAATQKHLTLTINNQDGGRNHTLLELLDQAQTPMGSRTIKKWLLRPLVDQTTIAQRSSLVHAMSSQVDVTQQLGGLLNRIADLERIIGRIALGRALRGDFLALKHSLCVIPALKAVLQTRLQTPLAQALQERLHIFGPLVQLLSCSLEDSPDSPHLIKSGFDYELDRVRNLATNSHEALLAFEAREIERTTIASLKVGYNQVSGYYLEVTNTQAHRVPSDYVAQQTLANRARFVTPELKALERDILRAQTEHEALEKEVFGRICHEVQTYLPQLRQTAQGVAHLDALYGFARCAYQHGYVVPTFTTQRTLSIKAGRHPVVEAHLDQPFVPNDIHLDEQQSLLVITGPNMGGKSTYLRQAALICVMAQCGSLVPAQSAHLPLLDRIFTRIGASDNVAQGKSTFMVEMEETALICNHATSRSLVILDEVGRGTSTQDGICLAQAIIEYISQTIKARCLFATHYQELTSLAETLPGVANFHVACTKQHENLIFFHKIIPGIAQGSFGLEVAKLAHLPASIIRRAKELYTLYDQTHLPAKQITAPTITMAASPIIEQLSALDLNRMSPKQVFDAVWELQEAIKQPHASAGKNECHKI